MSKIEEVIKAIKEADMSAYLDRDPAVPFPLVKLAQEALADSYAAMARAAIEAMREPTKPMIDVGADMIGDLRSQTSAMFTANETWAAMIDAALLEQQP